MPADKPLLHSGDGLSEYLKQLEVKGDTGQDIAPLLSSQIAAADATRVGTMFQERRRAFDRTVPAVAASNACVLIVGSGNGTWIDMARCFSLGEPVWTMGSADDMRALIAGPATVNPRWSEGYESNSASGVIEGSIPTGIIPDGITGLCGSSGGLPTWDFFGTPWQVPTGRALLWYNSTANQGMLSRFVLRDIR